MIPLPGMGAGLSLSAGGGGPSGAESNSGVSTALFSPFTFDNSNWQVQIKSSGPMSATSASGGQGAPSLPSLSGGPGGLNLPMIAMLAGAWFLLR